MLKDRATTNKQKKEILDRLYEVWAQGSNEYLRLGQLIETICQLNDFNLYNIEDYEFIEEVEKI